MTRNNAQWSKARPYSGSEFGLVTPGYEPTTKLTKKISNTRKKELTHTHYGVKSKQPHSNEVGKSTCKSGNVQIPLTKRASPFQKGSIMFNLICQPFRRLCRWKTTNGTNSNITCTFNPIHLDSSIYNLHFVLYMKSIRHTQYLCM